VSGSYDHWHMDISPVHAGMQMRPQTLAHAWGGTISYYQLNQAQSFSIYNDPHATSVMQNGAYFSLMEEEGGMTEISLSRFGFV